MSKRVVLARDMHGGGSPFGWVWVLPKGCQVKPGRGKHVGQWRVLPFEGMRAREALFIERGMYVGMDDVEIIEGGII